MEPSYNIQSCWGPRQETPADIAERYLRTLKALKPINPVFDHWYYLGLTKGALLTSMSREALIHEISTRTNNDETTDKPIIPFGYSATASNSLLRNPPGRLFDPDKITLEVHAGATASVGLINNAQILTAPLNERNAAYVTYDKMKAAMLVVIKSWDVTWCACYPYDIIDLWTVPRDMPWHKLTWITYLAEPYAALVKPPASAIVEHLPGGILLSATIDRFETANPDHLAIARDIEAALTPIVAQPWVQPKWSPPQSQ